MSSGSPPTLWWLLMRAASFVPDSITSGYSVPCTRNRAVREPARRFLEDSDEELADRLALVLGVGDARKALEEPVGGFHVHQLDALVAMEGVDDLLALARTHESGVDVDASELRAHRLVHDRGRYRGVDATGQTTDHALAADLRADRVDGGLDDRRHRPRRPAFATANRNCFSISCPRGVCATSDWNCTPKICLPSCSSTAAGVSGVRAGTWKPSGAVVMVSKWRHPDRLVGWSAFAEDHRRGRTSRATCGRTRPAPSGRPRRRAGGAISCAP